MKQFMVLITMKPQCINQPRTIHFCRKPTLISTFLQHDDFKTHTQVAFHNNK